MANSLIGGVGGGGGRILKFIKADTFVLPGSKGDTSTEKTQDYDLSSYGVSGKKAEDFFVRIVSVQAGAQSTESRKLVSVNVVDFANSSLLLKGTFDGYDGHAITMTIGIEIYVYTGRDSTNTDGIVLKAGFDAKVNQVPVTATFSGCKRYYVLISTYTNVTDVTVNKGTVSDVKQFYWCNYREITDVERTDSITVTVVFRHNTGAPQIAVIGVE